MTDLLWLLGSALVVLLATIVPAMIVLRILGADRLVSLSLAPALGAAGAGIGAMIAARLGIGWSLLPHLAVFAVLAPVAWGLRGAGVRLPSPAREVDGTPYEPSRPLLGAVPGAPWWLLGAALIALGPIAAAFGRADGILERWDTLYHLSALRRIRETGDGSSLHLGALSTTSGRAIPYPAAFHDLASLMPGAPIPVLLNASAAVLAVVPWVLGIALLARVLWPAQRWAPVAAALAALLAPAAPVNEWIHLSPIPNLVGFSMLPGVLTATVLLWRAVLDGSDGARTTSGGVRSDGLARRIVGVLTAAAVLAAGGIGLALLQPNAAVMALLLIAALTGVDALARVRTAPALLVVPVLLLIPVALLTWTPLAAMVTGFSGGLIVPWWQGLGEVLLGLLTVWPMTLGVLLVLLWWPGLARAVRGPSRWIVVAWLICAVLYLDAATDSAANLSVLFYRGQDRLSMPLTMVTCVLVVPGLVAWARVLRARLSAPLVAVLVIAAVAVSAASIPSRLEHARLNAALDAPGRGRFLQTDELAEFARVAPTMDRDGVILASPFSGASQLYGMTGQAVRFPVAGMSTNDADRSLLAAAGTAATDPAACRTLRDAGVRYIYQEHRPYQYYAAYQQVNRAEPTLGTVPFETSHSRLIEVDCATGA